MQTAILLLAPILIVVALVLVQRVRTGRWTGDEDDYFDATLPPMRRSYEARDQLLERAPDQRREDA